MAWNKTVIRFKPGFFILLCGMIFFIPIKWLISWIFAVLVHELFHYIAIYALKYPVSSFCFSLTGVYIRTGEMTEKDELIVAAAGPIGSVLLILLSKYIPSISVCALLQCAYNLIPLYPFDGGRILRNLIALLFKKHNADRVVLYVENTILSILTVMSVYITAKYMLGLFPLILLIPIFLKRVY